VLTAAVCAQLNIAYPVNGTQKKVEIDDDGKLCEPAALMFPPALRDALAAPLTVVTVRRRAFFDKRLSQEVEGDSLGEVRPRARASEQQRSTLLMLAFTACSGGRRACTAAGLQRLQARLPAPRGPLTGGVRRAAGVQGLRVQDPGRPGQAGLPDEAGRAGAGPGAGPDVAWRQLLPRLWPAERRAATEERAGLHRLAGPVGAEPGHREEGCAGTQPSARANNTLLRLSTGLMYCCVFSTVSSSCYKGRGERTVSTRQGKWGCERVTGCSTAWPALALARRLV